MEHYLPLSSIEEVWNVKANEVTGSDTLGHEGDKLFSYTIKIARIEV
jgi:hypothetical protein